MKAWILVNGCGCVSLLGSSILYALIFKLFVFNVIRRVCFTSEREREIYKYIYYGTTRSRKGDMMRHQVAFGLVQLYLYVTTTLLLLLQLCSLYLWVLFSDKHQNWQQTRVSGVKELWKMFKTLMVLRF